MYAQINGINIISFYLPSTLASAGYNEKKSLLLTAANSLPYTAATVATWWLADRWGRKPLLLVGGKLQFQEIIIWHQKADSKLNN